MIRPWTVALAIALGVSAVGQDPARLLSRQYVEGERLRYLMKAENDGATYQLHLSGTTIKQADGRFFEEFAFSDMVVNGAARALAPASQAFRLTMTLGGGAPFEMPDLSKAPGIIGPVTDLMTFYADLFLVMHQGALRNAGDRHHFSGAGSASWADGTVVVLGESHIEFDITLTAVDPAARLATILIKHVPPRAPKIKLPAEWMQARVADTPNNWVQVRKAANGFSASVGKETFDVTLTVDTSRGTIVTATMENPVTKVTRVCADAALTQCGEPQAAPTMRRVNLSLVRE